MTPEQEATLKDIGERLNYARGVHSQDRLAQMLLIDPEALYDLLLDILHDLEDARDERDEARRKAESLADELSGIQYSEFAVNESFKDIRKSNALPWEKDA